MSKRAAKRELARLYYARNTLATTRFWVLKTLEHVKATDVAGAKRWLVTALQAEIDSLDLDIAHADRVIADQKLKAGAIGQRWHRNLVRRSAPGQLAMGVTEAEVIGDL